MTDTMTTEATVETQVEIDETLVAEIEESLGELETLSPYKLSQIASALVGRTVQGPMVYNYVNKGFIKAHKNETQKWTVRRVDAAAWLYKFVSKHSK